MENINKYFEEQRKLEKDISDLWSCGKKSKSKQNRLNEVNILIYSSENEITLNRARKIIKIYKDLISDIPSLKSRAEQLLEEVK